MVSVQVRQNLPMKILVSLTIRKCIIGEVTLGMFYPVNTTTKKVVTHELKMAHKFEDGISSLNGHIFFC